MAFPDSTYRSVSYVELFRQYGGKDDRSICVDLYRRKKPCSTSTAASVKRHRTHRLHVHRHALGGPERLTMQFPQGMLLKMASFSSVEFPRA